MLSWFYAKAYVRVYYENVKNNNCLPTLIRFWKKKKGQNYVYSCFLLLGRYYNLIVTLWSRKKKKPYHHTHLFITKLNPCLPSLITKSGGAFLHFFKAVELRRRPLQAEGRATFKSAIFSFKIINAENRKSIWQHKNCAFAH